jgi:arabinose-5-phosphate isomerase
MSNDISIEKIMLLPENFTVIPAETPLVTVLERMSQSKIGHACVVDQNFKLVGVFTDGDFRRLILNIQKPVPALLGDDIIKFTTLNPKSVSKDSSFEDVKLLMSSNKIWDLPVVDENNILLGLIHMSSLLK